MRWLQAVKQIPITLLLAGFALLLHSISGLEPCLELHFADFPMLGFHRVLSCHFLHWSSEHLLWDLAVFIVLGALCEVRSPARYVSTLLLSAAVIPLCILYFLPHIDSYRGLSGLDTALFALLVTELVIQRLGQRDWSGTALFSLFLLGLLGKIATEMLCHQSIFVSDASFTPVPLAHLVGALVGGAIGALPWCGLRIASRSANGSGARTAAALPVCELHPYSGAAQLTEGSGTLNLCGSTTSTRGNRQYTKAANTSSLCQVDSSRSGRGATARFQQFR